MGLNNGQVIFVLFILLLFLLVSYIFYLWIEYSSGTNSSTVESSEGLYCPVNECAVSIETGKKRCPVLGDRIDRRAGELCSLPYQCSDPALPYAVWNDGSVNLQGNCPADVICDCISSPQCPSYITSSWYLSSGNITVLESRNIQSRPLLNQRSPPSSAISASEYCMVPYNWTIFGVPGCPASSNSEVSYSDIQACMNLPVSNSACLSGTLAYIPNNLSEFVPENYRQTPLGCVVGDPTACAGGVKVWDNYTGSIACRYSK